MSEFSGFVTLEGTFTDYLQVRDADKQPVEPDAAPTFRVYGASGLLPQAGGTATLGHTGSITGATNASPIVIASAAHGLKTGQRVKITGVGGNTNANSTWVITYVDDDHFSLQSSSGNSNYTSGGTFSLLGFYQAEIEATGDNGFEAGETFFVHFTWTVSSAARAEVHSVSVT